MEVRDLRRRTCRSRDGEAEGSPTREMPGRVLEELEQEQHAESLDVGTDSFDDADADDPYDPTEFIDEDDES